VNGWKSSGTPLQTTGSWCHEVIFAIEVCRFPIEKLSLKDDVDAGQELFCHCHLHEWASYLKEKQWRKCLFTYKGIILNRISKIKHRLNADWKPFVPVPIRSLSEQTWSSKTPSSANEEGYVCYVSSHVDTRSQFQVVWNWRMLQVIHSKCLTDVSMVTQNRESNPLN
jgi:hypothetical protein